jgi:hypothetical protein
MRKMLLLLVVLGGCAQDARLPASYFAEGAHVLAPGEASLTAAGGGAYGSIGEGIGGGARVRVGIGDGQEVGVEAGAEALKVQGDECVADCDSWANEVVPTQTIYAYSAMGTWKRALSDNLAMVVGLGLSEHDSPAGFEDTDYYGHSVDSSLALIGSHMLSRRLDFYAGGRIALAVPYGPRDQVATDVIGGNFAAGFDYAMFDRLHVFVEAGPRLISEGNDSWIPWISAEGVTGLTLRL